jgi:hypothetical protein
LPSSDVLASLSVEVAVGCVPFAGFSSQMLASVIRWVKGIVDKHPLVSIIAVADVPWRLLDIRSRTIRGK